MRCVLNRLRKQSGLRCVKTGWRSVLTVDDRGQIVLPKHIREKAGMNTGDRLALIVWEGENKVCCLGLIKAENLNSGVKEVVSPFFE